MFSVCNAFKGVLIDAFGDDTTIQWGAGTT
jgi:hypothetical protein